jgi:hypothetical protein
MRKFFDNPLCGPPAVAGLLCHFAIAAKGSPTTNCATSYCLRIAFNCAKSAFQDWRCTVRDPTRKPAHGIADRHANRAGANIQAKYTGLQVAFFLQKGGLSNLFYLGIGPSGNGKGAEEDLNL